MTPPIDPFGENPHLQSATEFASLKPVAQEVYDVHQQLGEQTLVLDGLTLPMKSGTLEEADQQLTSQNRALMVVRAAEWYISKERDQYNEENIFKYDEAARLLTDREGFARFLSSQVGYTGNTLETAAGTGLISLHLLPNASELVLTDISEPALRLLRERMAGRACVERADFLDLPFGNHDFDTIVCVGGYRYVPEEHKAHFWGESRKALKKGGRFILGQFHPRGVPINGLDLRAHEAGRIDGFSLRSVRGYESRIEMPLFSVKSGRYDIFEMVAN